MNIQKKLGAAICIILLVGVFGVAGGWYVHRRHFQQREMELLACAQKIGAGLQTYVVAHGGMTPASLRELVPDYLDDTPLLDEFELVRPSVNMDTIPISSVLVKVRRPGSNVAVVAQQKPNAAQPR
jgi:hypothetical protein